jgi:hypothetical protein
MGVFDVTTKQATPSAPAVSVATSSRIRKYFAFSLHKSGSTLLFNLLRGAALRSQSAACNKRMGYVSIPDDLFNAGTPESVMLDPGFVSPVSLDEQDTIYGGFRFVPAFLDGQHLKGAGLMLLVRDPRDVLTSLYYSVTKSHVMPQGEAGKLMKAHRESVSAMAIDDFVLNQARNSDWVQRYRRISSLKHQGKSWCYEDVIFEKSRWFDEILDYLELDLPARLRTELVKREDIVPASERPENHVRQVAPGDHRRKLKPETIEELNALFAGPLAEWGHTR